MVNISIERYILGLVRRILKFAKKNNLGHPIGKSMIFPFFQFPKKYILKFSSNSHQIFFIASVIVGKKKVS